MKVRSLSIFALFICSICSVQLSGAETYPPLRFFVSLEGDDAWSGRLESPSPNAKDGPLRSMEAARNAIRQLSPAERGAQTIEVCILPGTQIRDKPFLLETQDSGTKAAPIVYRAWKDEPTVISGGKAVRQWKRSELNGRSVLVADLSQLSDGYVPFEQLWVNHRRAVQARTPNSGSYFKIESVPVLKSNPRDRKSPGKQFVYFEKDADAFSKFDEGVAVVFNKWLEYHMPLDQIDLENRVFTSTKKSSRRVQADDDFYLEGAASLLDQPGEWYLDRQEDKLYYLPREGESEIVAMLPSLTNVVLAKGDAANARWVENVQFRGLTFSHTDWVLPRDSEPSGLQQASVPLEGAVRLLDARHFVFEECEITAVGNYGLEIGPGSSRNRVLRCKIHDLGGGGILIGPKIRPRSGSENTQRKDYPPVLKSPSDATSHNEVADCSIYDGGRYFHCAVGIWIGQSPDNIVHHNEIYDFYYSGISSGWTWGYGPGLAQRNRFEYNHIHHIGQRRDGDGRVLSDMGAIYTLGDQTGTVIRNNVIHDVNAGKYGGFGIYMDEGSRYILVKNNLVYRCRHNCFLQHYGKENIIRNNIFAFSGKSIAALAREDSHISFRITNNILLNDGPPIYSGGYMHKVNSVGAYESDSNLVWSTKGKVIGAQDQYFPSRKHEPDKPMLAWEERQELGYDQHSLIGDPGFVDPEHGDFRFKDGNPASRIGFKPFPLDEAGPRQK